MRNSSEIRAKAFVAEHDRLDPTNPITPDLVLRLHFDGILDRYIEVTENIAEKIRPNDQETAHRLTAGIVFAGKRSIGASLHILDKFAEHDPKTFLAMLRHALDDDATQRILASIVRSGSEDPEIQELIDYHRPGREADVEEVKEWSQDADLDSVTRRFEADAQFRMKVIQDVRRSDPTFFDGIFEDLRSGKFRDDADKVEVENAPSPSTRRNLTVAEARKRVMAHTGQSERAVIRDTRGWDADRIIALIT